MLLLLYTAAGVRSELLLSSVDLSRPTVHCKVLWVSSPKAWLVSFNRLVKHCVYHIHTTWVLVVGVSWPARSALQGLVGLFAFAFKAWLAPFDGQLCAACVAGHHCVYTCIYTSNVACVYDEIPSLGTHSTCTKLATRS